MAEPYRCAEPRTLPREPGKITGRPEAKPKSDIPLSSLLGPPGKRPVAAVAAPLAAFSGLRDTGLLNEALSYIVACRVRGLTAPPEPGPEFGLLAATLDRDSDGRQPRRSFEAATNTSAESAAFTRGRRSARRDESCNDLG
jgi:hypothetical protein